MTSRSELYAVVDRFFDGERAAELAGRLTDFYRSPGSSGFLEATSMVEDGFRARGFENLEITEYPLKNSWDPIEASLALVIDDSEEILVDYETAPPCLAWWSESTSAEGEKLEVVDVGTGETEEHFRGKDVEGKAVFVHGTTRRPGWWEAARLAIDHGARGIITDYMLYQVPGVREPELVPEAVQLLRLPVAEDSGVWAFSISKNASDSLLEQLNRGSAEVRAKVKVETGPSVLRNVVASIPGSDLPEEIVMYCAHTSGVKPGGNCAEGPGMVVELAGAMKKAIEAGELPAPRRTVKFLIGCEGAGVGAYLKDHPEEIDRMQVAFTFCSPGHRQDLTKSNLMLYRSPDSVPGYINEYLSEVATEGPKEADWVEKDGGKELPQIRFAEHFYTPWSDNGRFAAGGVQAPLFMSWPDRYFHSQLLTREVIDPVVLRRAALITGVAGLELASADGKDAARIARLVAGKARSRLSRLAARIRQEDGCSVARGRRMLTDRAKLDSSALRRLLDLVDATEREDLLAEIERLEGEMSRDLSAELASLPETDEEVETSPEADLVPKRISEKRAPRWAGLEYADLIKVGETLQARDENAGFNSLRVVADEVWAFIDGVRTVGDIALAVGFEFDLDLDPAGVLMLLRGLEKEGYVDIN